MNYKSQEELFRSLKGAFDVKIRLIGINYSHIRIIDIWNYLKITKWAKTKGLTLSEMVNDIINADIKSVDTFINRLSKIN